MPARRLLLALPLLAVACANPGASDSAPAPRFAAAMQQADEVTERVFARMDGFERRVGREQVAIGFALGIAAAPSPGVAAAAGEVLAPAIAALAAHAERLHAASTGEDADVEAGGELLDEAAAAGLDRLRQAGVLVPDAERQAGLAGIRTLAAEPAGGPRRGDVPKLAGDADPQFRAVSVLLRRVIGFDAGSGVRGVLRAQRTALDAAEARFLDAVRRDRNLGPTQRYALVRDLAEAREGDPLFGTFDALVAMLAAAEAAHAAIAAGGGGPEVAALEGAVARLNAYGAAPGRD